MGSTPLSGVRILDLTHYIAGPYCTKLFADLGADVIKIEKPGGDGGRWLHPFIGDEPHPEKSALFLYVNTNKRSVILDLKTAKGIRLFKDLVRDTDILVENFRPGVMSRLGIDYGTLERLNPALVMTSISNFGQDGPYRDWAATDLTFNALSGMMAVTGRRDREPVKLGLSQVQYSAGVAAAIATLAAYRQRQLCGYGQRVDVAVVEPFFNMMHQQFGRYNYQGSLLLRESPTEFPFYLETKDGWLHTSRLQMGAIVDFLDLPGLDDPKFVDPSNQLEFVRLVEPWFREQSKFVVFEEAQLHGLMWAPAHTEADLLNCPQLKEREYFVEIDHPVVGRAQYPGRYFVSDQIESPPLRPSPKLGQHTKDVLEHSWQERPGESSLRSDSTHIELASPAGNLEPQVMPLAGIRILSLEHWAALPHATKYLASLGAEVIVVESPIRVQGVTLEARGKEISGGLYLEGGRSKLGISLDLSKPEGIRLFKRLVKISDVVVDNFTPRVMKNFGLDYECLREVKHDIIVLSISGFGHKGPWDLFRGYSITAESASGLTNLTGYPDGPPVRPGGTPPGDVIPALHAAWSILGALEHRKRTGEGAFLDVSMVEPCCAQLGEAIVSYSLTGRAGERSGNRDPNAAPSGCYRCAGKDRWVTIAATTEEQWRALVAVLGNPDWAIEERFSAQEYRQRHQEELDRLIEEWTLTRDNMEVMKVCQEVGVPAGAVLTVREVLSNEHYRQRGSFEVVRHALPPEGVGDRLHIGPPWKLSKTPASTARPARVQLGKDNDYVYRELLGLTEEELSELAGSIVGTNSDAPMGASGIQGNLAYRGLLWPLDLEYEENFLELLGLQLPSSED